MRHFVFDFDGTLVDTDGLFADCLAFALEPFQIDVGSNFMERIRHKHPHRIFEDDLPPKDAELALKRLQEVGRDLSKRIKSFDGIEETLDLLASRGVSLSIWTGRDGASTKRILQNVNLFDRFERIISGTCVETNKPGHEGLNLLADHFNAKHDELVMIGDHHHDIEPANQLGCFSVHAKWKRKPHILPEGIEPKKSFESVLNFKNWASQI